MNWLYYLGEANLYLGAFYLCYCLFLTKETHYTLNRAYLLFSCLVSFVLPLVQLGFLKPAEQPVEYATTVAVDDGHFTLGDVLLYCYLVGVVILIVQLAAKIIL